MSEFSHFDKQGKVHMIDVGNKQTTRRTAVAKGQIKMAGETLKRIVDGKHKKGDVFAVARVAGIMAAKKTADLVPLCHSIGIDSINIEFSPDHSQQLICCTVTVTTHAQTGVEMEALTAVQIALLTIYDMCKSADRGMTMENIKLLSKEGGKSGTWQRAE